MPAVSHCLTPFICQSEVLPYIHACARLFRVLNESPPHVLIVINQWIQRSCGQLCACLNAHVFTGPNLH